MQGLCRFLVAQGVKIEGIGSNMLRIHGVGGFENLKSADHTIGADYLEIGSFIAMSAMTGGDLVIQNINPIDLRMIKFVFERVGINWRYQERENEIDLVMKSPYALKIQTDVHGEIPKIDDVDEHGRKVA